MIIEQNTEFKAMRFIVRHWHKSFSAYEIAKGANISVPMVYNIIKKLKMNKVVLAEGREIKLDFNNPFSYSFKLMCDSERILGLSEEEQSKINFVFNVLFSEYGSNLLAFVIFGSVASKEQNDKSDIDMLAVVNKKKEIDYRKRGLLSIGKINIIEKEKNEIEKDYLLANDLVLNVLMNGIIIHDTGIIRFLLSKPVPSPSAQIIMQKKERINTLKSRLLELLNEGNDKEIAEQLRFFIIEKARILFLQKGIIPSSRKYITDNLKKVDSNLHKDYWLITNKNAREVLRKYV